MRRGTRGRGYGGRPPVPHQPQMNIPRLLQPSQSNSGPLMTDHLQGLKDIDLELELLKRKREIIEQQQQILSDSYRQRNDYDQPMFSQGRQSRYDDFTRLYENPREPGYGNRGAGGRKRPHISVWESEAPPKRLPTPARGGKKALGSRLSPAPTGSRWNFKRPPEPLFPAPKPNKRPPPAPQKKKEFQPSKVSKPSAGSGAKLASYQPAERKRLAAEAVASGARAAEALVLRADREPSNLMVGRLELALGGVMKAVKAAHPQHEHIFKQPHVQRAMKQCVRDRIRTAMIGKEVSTTENILVAYYQMFPEGGDDDVVMKGLRAHENKDFITVDADNPETYFKRNMRNLMALKMEEMINKLHAEYSLLTSTANRKNSQKPNSIETKQPEADTEQSTTADPQSDAKPQTVETQPENVTQTVETKQENITQTVETKPENVTKTVEMQSENVTQSVDQKITQPKDDTELKIGVNAEAVKEEPVIKESSAETKPKVEFVKPAPPEKAPAIVVPEHIINNERYIALDKLLNYKMLHLLKRYAPEFLKHMEVDAMYRKTKAAIIAETARKLGRSPKGLNEAPDEAEPQDQPDETPEKPRQPLQYFIRILGRPSLPKRKIMEGFFKEFKPKIIKKHRTIHNVLFVGFVEKEPYDKMLAADGTTIGRSTLDIKVSERNDNKKNGNTANNSTTSEADKLNESIDSVIGPDLDEQITDLLSSIRNNDSFHDFSDDIVMAEPPVFDNNAEKENREQNKVEAVVDLNANNEEAMDDIVEARGVPQSDDAQDNDVEIIDAQNDDDVVEVKDVQNNVETKNTQDDDDVVEVKDAAQKDDVNDQTTNNETTTEKEVAEKKDTVRALKTDVTNVKVTPTRASARLATPSAIKTRRMSKLTE